MVFLLLFLIDLVSADDAHFYEAEEGSNLTLSWDSPTPMDLSRIHMTCFVSDEPTKMLIYVIGGVHKYQDEQFSGRVQCDRETLRQGQVQLLLTRLTLLDSGQYRCDMAAKDDPDKEEWDFITTEKFELKVIPKSSVLITAPDEDTENERRPAALKMKYDPGITGGTVVGVLFGAFVFWVGVMCLMRACYNVKDKD